MDLMMTKAVCGLVLSTGTGWVGVHAAARDGFRTDRLVPLMR